MATVFNLVLRYLINNRQIAESVLLTEWALSLSYISVTLTDRTSQMSSIYHLGVKLPELDILMT